MAQVDLGDGRSAEIKEVDELTSGDQDAVMAHMRVRQDPESGELIFPGNMSGQMRKALLRRIITGWNLPHPLPSKRPDSLDKLTLGQQKALFEAITEHMKLIQEKPDDPEAEGSDPTSDSAS